MNRRWFFAIWLLIFVAACSQVNKQPEQVQQTPQVPANQTAQQPTIEATPTEQSGQWKVIKSENVTLTVTAPGAKEVKILYRPLVAEGRHVELKSLSENDQKDGKFSTQFKTVSDFVGDVWAEVVYPDGSKKETETIVLTAQNENNPQPEQSAVNSSEKKETQPEQSLPDNSQNAEKNLPQDEDRNLANSPTTGNENTSPTTGNENASKNENNSKIDNLKDKQREDQSARSDQITGGKIEKASLQNGQPDIKITVNVPAFQLTLWQNGKEIKTYPIGVGQKDFPIVIGERNAKEIIWNPTWVPPDKPWVTEDIKDVKPGEHVEADDPRNPLGKIKIPLGDGYLIHEAQSKSDIGRLVSHGCIRLLKDDLLDLSWNIIKAQDLPVTEEQIKHVKNSTERMVTKLERPIPVDINYDTDVVENGVLHLYPDVYERQQNNVEDLREELESNGVDVSKLDDETLKQMVQRVKPKEEFVVNISDIKAGRLQAGENKPLTLQPSGKRPAKKKAVRTHQRGV